MTNVRIVIFHTHTAQHFVKADTRFICNRVQKTKKNIWNLIMNHRIFGRYIFVSHLVFIPLFLIDKWWKKCLSICVQTIQFQGENPWKNELGVFWVGTEHHNRQRLTLGWLLLLLFFWFSCRWRFFFIIYFFSFHFIS